jgi:hypothetical protein
VPTAAKTQDQAFVPHVFPVYAVSNPEPRHEIDHELLRYTRSHAVDHIFTIASPGISFAGFAKPGKAAIFLLSRHGCLQIIVLESRCHPVDLGFPQA